MRYGRVAYEQSHPPVTTAAVGRPVASAGAARNNIPARQSPPDAAIPDWTRRLTTSGTPLRVPAAPDGAPQPHEQARRIGTQQEPLRSGTTTTLAASAAWPRVPPLRGRHVAACPARTGGTRPSPRLPAVAPPRAVYIPGRGVAPSLCLWLWLASIVLD